MSGIADGSHFDGWPMVLAQVEEKNATLID